MPQKAAQDSAADEIIKIADDERDAKIRAAMDFNNAVSELNQDSRIDDGIINTALESADLLNLGTEDDFISGFVSSIF